MSYKQSYSKNVTKQFITEAKITYVVIHEAFSEQIT